MVRKLLRLFKEYRELEKNLEGAGGLIASQGRYIEALEGRDKERLARIEELETKSREALGVLRDMRTRLAGLRPNHKEEEKL
jgi:hypothetical protein